MNANPLYLLGRGIGVLDNWNRAVQRSIDAYHQDRSRAEGRCVTCHNKAPQNDRHCWSCKNRRRTVAETSRRTGKPDAT